MHKILFYNKFIKCLYIFRALLCSKYVQAFNPLNAELNPICYLLALLEAHHILHVSRIRVNKLIIKQDFVQQVG